MFFKALTFQLTIYHTLVARPFQVIKTYLRTQGEKYGEMMLINLYQRWRSKNIQCLWRWTIKLSQSSRRGHKLVGASYVYTRSNMALVQRSLAERSSIITLFDIVWLELMCLYQDTLCMYNGLSMFMVIHRTHICVSLMQKEDIRIRGFSKWMWCFSILRIYTLLLWLHLCGIDKLVIGNV